MWRWLAAAHHRSTSDQAFAMRPESAQPPAEPASTPSANRNGEAKKVVRSEKSWRIVRDMLQRVGYGAEALGMLVEVRPDLMILDWDLAILTGEEVIRLVRDAETSPAPTVPLILMLSHPARIASNVPCALASTRSSPSRSRPRPYGLASTRSSTGPDPTRRFATSWFRAPAFQPATSSIGSSQFSACPLG